MPAFMSCAIGIKPISQYLTKTVKPRKKYPVYSFLQHFLMPVCAEKRNLLSGSLYSTKVLGSLATSKDPPTALSLVFLKVKRATFLALQT